MSPEQARDLQHEMSRLAAALNAGHAEPTDLRLVAMTLAEVLAHIACALEARTPKGKRHQ